jgi:predicted small lipoprotein YifL
MTTRWLTLVCLILWLSAFGAACGKYGPPVRVPSQAEPAPVVDIGEEEDDSDQKEKKR